MLKNNRRTFLKKAALGALSTPLYDTAALFSCPTQKQGTQKGSMFYRRLGRTDLEISEISLGGSPIPEWHILMQAVERGVNYIDTSHSYMNGNSERQIGKLLKAVGRDKIHVGTKFHLRRNWNEDTIIRSVEGSLNRLQTDYIDVLLIHGAGRKEELIDERLLSAYSKLKESGKFRFSGLSCHSNHQEVVSTAIGCGHYDMVQLGYNVFDIAKDQKDIETYDDYLGASGIRQLLSLAADKDIGIIAMKTLKIGSRRQNLEKYRAGSTSIFQAMLKWVLMNKNIASVCTEILNEKELEEDLGIVGQPLTSHERRSLFTFVAENSEDYCHMCGRCQSSCPQRIQTTSILRYLAYYENYNKVSRARSSYAHLQPEQTSVNCLNCGTCENNCLYGVSIRNRIHHAHYLLG